MATFREARVVAGFGGSAMFNLMYAENLEGVILLNQEAYIARNEHLFTSLTGGEVHYFWSRPDVEHPEGGFSSRRSGQTGTSTSSATAQTSTRLSPG